MKRILRRLKFMLMFWKFFPFLLEFFRTPEVNHSKKIFGVVLIIAYFLFPFDLIPDFLGVIGILDDVMLAAFVLERFVKIAPPALKKKYGLLDKVDK
ncbi:uncharacterized membrane protein YkvA (DUF1232 family) [Evansella vedderi]|uniref:Uncharacterized membrane protein YkvA (DUF1232 family) n=1 Tax=Evansella vedderi TaxID=38282 RepID=A0ABT9ZN55_9BACI|nr:DUF1232 domain-containing protein [Evansella vedderi]MDQ0252661.1 uncharacterized membrane protein YkvA (DUF1232 family) [Evansella vedderi]